MVSFYESVILLFHHALMKLDAMQLITKNRDKFSGINHMKCSLIVLNDRRILISLIQYKNDDVSRYQ